jgi:uncharacterized BrkB/YihY/UPF0761 family membrane protein
VSEPISPMPGPREGAPPGTPGVDPEHISDPAAADATPAEPVSRTARAKAQAEQLRARADQKVKEYEARRSTSRTIDAVFSTYERDTSHGGGVLAAALAFRIFIFLVPFVFVVVTAFPVAAEGADADPVELAQDFGMAGLASTAVRSANNLELWQRLLLLVVGAFALFLASKSMVRVLRITHGLAWTTRVPKLERPSRAALALILVVTGAIAFAVVTKELFDDYGILGLLPQIIGIVFLVAIWTAVQHHLPHQEGVKWTDQLPGALLVAFGIEVLHLVTVIWFTRSLESKSETYGAIGAALAILLWAYFLGRIIVSGAMLNAVLWDQRHRPAGAQPSAPARPEEHQDPGR